MAEIIPITNVCNQNCLFCSAAGRGEPDPRDLTEKITQCQGSVVFTGGETLLVPAILESLVRTAKNRGLKVEIQSNGMLFSQPKMARHFRLLGVDLFNINFPSHIPDLADRITQTPGSQNLRLAGIENLLAAGARVRLTHIVNALNYQQLADLPTFIQREFPHIHFVQFSFIKLQGAAATDASIVPTYKEVSPFMIKALDQCLGADISCGVDHMPPCWLGEHWGRSIDLQKTSQGGELKYARAEKEILEACDTCRWRDRCTGPRQDYIGLFGEEGAVQPV